MCLDERGEPFCFRKVCLDGRGEPFCFRKVCLDGLGGRRARFQFALKNAQTIS
jgi:hypothetical protein